MRLKESLWAVGLATGILVVGCEPEWFHRGISARNDTDVEITFIAVVGAERVQLRHAAPGETVVVLGGSSLIGKSRFGSEYCTSVDLVALDPDGEEVARATPPLCHREGPGSGPEWTVP